MAPSKKKKVVIPKPDMPALVPADCHIGKGDVEDGAEQGEGGAWEICESLDPELERLLAGHCVKEDQSVEVGTFNYIQCGMSTNVQTGEKRVLFWYGMLIIPKKIPEPNKNDLCMRFPNNYFYFTNALTSSQPFPLDCLPSSTMGVTSQVMKHPTTARHLLMRARKMKVVMMRTMVTMATTRRMAQVAHPKAKKEKKRKNK